MNFLTRQAHFDCLRWTTFRARHSWRGACAARPKIWKKLTCNVHGVLCYLCWHVLIFLTLCSHWRKPQDQQWWILWTGGTTQEGTIKPERKLPGTRAPKRHFGLASRPKPVLRLVHKSTNMLRKPLSRDSHGRNSQPLEPIYCTLCIDVMS